MKNRKRDIESVTTGILDGLASLESQDEGLVEQKSKVKAIEPEGEDPDKKYKRSYMLTKKHIKKVSLLKAHLEINDLSEIVRQAIDLYYKEKTGEDKV